MVAASGEGPAQPTPTAGEVHAGVGSAGLEDDRARPTWGTLLPSAAPFLRPLGGTGRTQALSCVKAIKEPGPF